MADGSWIAPVWKDVPKRWRPGLALAIVLLAVAALGLFVIGQLVSLLEPS